MNAWWEQLREKDEKERAERLAEFEKQKQQQQEEQKKHDEQQQTPSQEKSLPSLTRRPMNS
jgi:hypothetical protein